jgi:hypothetical protein
MIVGGGGLGEKEKKLSINLFSTIINCVEQRPFEVKKSLTFNGD